MHMSLPLTCSRTVSNSLASSLKPLSSWSKASAAVTISGCLSEPTRNKLALHQLILHFSYPLLKMGFSGASK